jgi:hypothetical protein
LVSQFFAEATAIAFGRIKAGDGPLVIDSEAVINTLADMILRDPKLMAAAIVGVIDVVGPGAKEIDEYLTDMHESLVPMSEERAKCLRRQQDSEEILEYFEDNN